MKFQINNSNYIFNLIGPTASHLMHPAGRSKILLGTRPYFLF